MASRASLNKVLLIGNLTRDPELRYTPSGAAVCTFGLATNRTYVSSDGTKKEEAEFTKIVSWNKLAELCSQLLAKGRKVYVEGRLQTRSWETPDGVSKQTTEVVIEDMRILDSKKSYEESAHIAVDDEGGSVKNFKAPEVSQAIQEEEVPISPKSTKTKSAKKSGDAKKTEEKSTDEDKLDLDDLPF